MPVSPCICRHARSMCIDMCAGKCIDMGIDICTEVCTEMCIAARMDTFTGMHIGMSADTFIVSSASPNHQSSCNASIPKTIHTESQIVIDCALFEVKVLDAMASFWIGNHQLAH